MRCLRDDLGKLEHGMGSKLPANRRSRERARIKLRSVYGRGGGRLGGVQVAARLGIHVVAGKAAENRQSWFAS